MKSQIFAAVALASSLCACASPLVAPNPPAFQAKAEHLRDWQDMARRAVTALPSTTSNQKLSVYVDTGAPTPFSTAYKKDLEQALFEANYPVMTTPVGAQIVVRADAQWFYYGHGNEKPITNYATLYGLAALVMGQTRNISRVDTALAVGAAAAPVIDFLAAMNDTTRAEVVVRTTISGDDRYHFIGSENIYVQPRDLVFYMGGDAATDTLDAPVVTLRVSAQ